MKLVLNFPISTMNLSMETVTVKGDTLLNVSIYEESKVYRITALDINDVDSEAVRLSWGRGETRLFKGIDDNGKSWFVFAIQQPRKYYRINEDYNTLKASFNTSCNSYPQGKFLFNLDKSKKISPALVELYDLDVSGKIDPSVYDVTILDLISNVSPGKISQSFPLLTRAIPAKQQKGLFFTETQVYWLERSVDQIYNITKKFFPTESFEPKLLDGVNYATLGTPKLPELKTDHVVLPHYNEQKAWVSPPVPPKCIRTLLDRATEYEQHPPVRIILQNKANRKSSGRYQITGSGTFGRDMLDDTTINSLRARMNGSSTMIITGSDFIMLYTLADVNAIYFRAKKPEPITFNIKEEPKVIEQLKVFDNTTTANETFITEVFGTKPDEIKGTTLNVDEPTEINVSPFVSGAPNGGGLYENTKSIKPPSTRPKYTDEFDYIFSTSPLVRHFIDLEPVFLANQRMVFVTLPAPYGASIVWTNVSNENIIERLRIEDRELVVFGSTSFYRKGEDVIMTDTAIILNEFARQHKGTAEERFLEALNDIAKEKSLVEIINIVTKKFSH